MTLGDGVLLGICNPLLDLVTSVDGEYLKKYKLKENDAILANEEHLSIYSELAKIPSTLYIPGGAAQNSIRGAQKFLPKGSTTFIGCVGNDDFGKKLSEIAGKDGVKTAYMIHPTVQTGTCAVLVNGKHRSLVANLAAANEFKESHFEKPEIQDLLTKAKVFYISGFFLTVSPASMELICKHAAEHNKIVTMNVSAPFIAQFFKEPLLKLIEYSDYVFCNETEAKAVAESLQLENSNDMLAIAKYIQKMAKKTNRYRTVVITQGSEDVVIATVEGIKTYPVEQIPQSAIVDTNGAGDAFVGGFLAKLVLEKDIEQCVKAGNYLAREVIQQSGAIYPEKILME
eukprot:NODE_748_length_4248_cov_1.384912.p2 type:complete len:342 gc:universal NODE_748_length_4248_cov_1.384912:3216-2191(-)